MIKSPASRFGLFLLVVLCVVAGLAFAQGPARARGVSVVNFPPGFVTDGGVVVLNFPNDQLVHGWVVDDGGYNPAAGTVFDHASVAQETPILSLNFQYNINTALVSTTTIDGGTVTQASARAVLQTSTSNSGSALLQSKDIVRYVPGQGIMMRFTATFSTCVASSRQEIGLATATDGFLWGCVGNTFGIIHRNAGAETLITSFNGAPLTWDITKGNIYSIAYQWLGYGVIRFYVEAPTGQQVLVHQIQYPNSATLPSLSNPALAPWVKVANSGNTTNLTLATPSIGVVTQGSVSTFSLAGAAHNRVINVTTTPSSIITIRNKATFAGATNRVRVKVTFMSMSATGTADVLARLLTNPTIDAGTVFSDFDTNTSVVEVSSTNLATVGGRAVFAAVLGGGNADPYTIPNPVYLNPGDILMVEASAQTGTPNVQASLVWTEDF